MFANCHSDIQKYYSICFNSVSVITITWLTYHL
jgi:hypothetical protein